MVQIYTIDINMRTLILNHKCILCIRFTYNLEEIFMKNYTCIIKSY